MTENFSDKRDALEKEANLRPSRVAFSDLNSEALREIFQLLTRGLGLLRRPHIGGCFRSRMDLFLIMRIKLLQIVEKPTSISDESLLPPREGSDASNKPR